MMSNETPLIHNAAKAPMKESHAKGMVISGCAFCTACKYQYDNWQALSQVVASAIPRLRCQARRAHQRLCYRLEHAPHSFRARRNAKSNDLIHAGVAIGLEVVLGEIRARHDGHLDLVRIGNSSGVFRTTANSCSDR
jgi:hypothetical protein